MTRTRIAASSVALLALLTACGGGAGSTTPAASSAVSTPSSSPSQQESSTPTPDDSSSSPSVDASGLASSLVALQLCGTTLGYAAGAIAGVPAEQLATLEKGVESAQSKAGAAEAELLAQSKAVVDAAKSGNQDAITAAAQKLGDLCGAG